MPDIYVNPHIAISTSKAISFERQRKVVCYSAVTLFIYLFIYTHKHNHRLLCMATKVVDKIIHKLIGDRPIIAYS